MDKSVIYHIYWLIKFLENFITSYKGIDKTPFRQAVRAAAFNLTSLNSVRISYEETFPNDENAKLAAEAERNFNYESWSLSLADTIAEHTTKASTYLLKNYDKPWIHNSLSVVQIYAILAMVTGKVIPSITIISRRNTIRPELN